MMSRRFQEAMEYLVDKAETMEGHNYYATVQVESYEEEDGTLEYDLTVLFIDTQTGEMYLDLYVRTLATLAGAANTQDVVASVLRDRCGIHARKTHRHLPV